MRQRLNGVKYMSAAEWRATAKPKPKRAKYGNRPVTVDGVRIDSKREAKRWAELQRLQTLGTIYRLVRQPVFILAPGVHIAGEARKRPAMRYRADFAYFDAKTNERVIEDVKSAPTAKTAEFRRTQHLMKIVHDIDVRVIL